VTVRLGAVVVGPAAGFVSGGTPADVVGEAPAALAVPTIADTILPKMLIFSSYLIYEIACGCDEGSEYIVPTDPVRSRGARQ
jgi:hypothetical protein